MEPFSTKNWQVFYLKHVSKLLLKAKSNSRPRYPCSYPSSVAHSQGNPSTRWATTASVAASTRHGMNANFVTTKLNLLRAAESRPRPALMRMTTIATNLQHDDAPTFLLLTSVTFANIYFLFIALVLIYIGWSKLLTKKSGKCFPLEYTYFLNIFLANLHSSVVLMLIYCRQNVSEMGIKFSWQRVIHKSAVENYSRIVKHIISPCTV